MAKLQLTLDTIGELDGGNVRAMIDRELNRAVADLDDRGQEDEKPRKVTIEVEMLHKKGMVTCSVKAKATLPPMQSGMTVTDVRMVGKGQPGLVFQALNPENPNQPTLDDYETRKEGD